MKFIKLSTLFIYLIAITMLNSGFWTSGMNSDHRHDVSANYWASGHPNNHTHSVPNTLGAGAHSHTFTNASPSTLYGYPRMIVVRYIIKARSSITD